MYGKDTMTHPPISRFYEEDHDRLDRLFQEFQRLKQNDFLKAREIFSQFYAGLERHILWEEEILFPVFEEKSGMHQVGPTAVMRIEHTQIRGFLEVIHQRLLEGSPDTDKEEALLQNYLGMHNMKEEKILYPAIDRLITDAERDRIFRDMKKHVA
jgi:regulator of cell morphogenesis and NO signaling